MSGEGAERRSGAQCRMIGAFGAGCRRGACRAIGAGRRSGAHLGRFGAGRAKRGACRVIGADCRSGPRGGRGMALPSGRTRDGGRPLRPVIAVGLAQARQQLPRQRAPAQQARRVDSRWVNAGVAAGFAGRRLGRPRPPYTDPIRFRPTQTVVLELDPSTSAGRRAPGS